MSSDSDEEDLVGALAGGFSKFQIHCDPELSDRKYRDAKKAWSEDGLRFDPSDYPESKRSKLLEFLETSAPSKVKRSDGIGWISVRSPSFEDEEFVDREELCTVWEEHQKSKEKIDFDAITKLAKTYSHLGGSWLLFFDTGVPVDTAWEKISRATVEDKLGTHANVTPFEDEGEGKELHDNHCISVSTNDFTDKDDVLAVEAALRGLGFKDRMPYKPHVYSTLGIYAHNQWGLRPSIYSSQWDTAEQAGSIRDNTKTPYTVMIN